MELDSYYEGYDAAVEEYPLTDNPYQADTDNWHSWYRGWLEGTKDLSNQ